MRSNPRLFIFALFFCLIMFGISCEYDSIKPDENDQYEELSLDNFRDNIKENLKIQFDEFEIAYTSKGTSSTLRSSDENQIKWIEYDAEYNGHFFIEDSTSSRNIFFSLLKCEIGEDEEIFMLLKFVPSETLDRSKEYSYFALQDFSGTIYTYNLDGEMEYAVGVSEGLVQEITSEVAIKKHQVLQERKRHFLHQIRVTMT